MATCSVCTRHDIPIKPWCMVIAAAHVDQGGRPCRDFKDSDIDLDRANRAMENDALWELT